MGMTNAPAGGRFAGQVVLVTGAAKGQGRGHAVRFAEEGASLLLCDIAEQLDTAGRMGTAEELEATADLVRAAGAAVVSRRVDVRDDVALQALVDDAVETFGTVDVLVANAGIATYAPLETLSDAWWDDMVDINLTGVANAMRAVAPVMRERRSGAIVATSSAAAREGVPNAAHYSAAKWGVIGLVKSAAIELGPFGVTVNAVCPMSVDTDMCHNQATYTLFRPDLDEPTRDAVADTFASLNVMGVPWLDVRDVTEAVVYLTSEAGRYVTGTALDIAGGWNAGHLA